MFLTPERAVVLRMSVSIAQQIADAESLLTELPEGSPESGQVRRWLGKLRQATHRVDRLMCVLGEQRCAAPAPHFAIPVRGIAHNRQ